jgi:hypothetical protein
MNPEVWDAKSLTDDVTRELVLKFLLRTSPPQAGAGAAATLPVPAYLIRRRVRGRADGRVDLQGLRGHQDPRRVVLPLRTLSEHGRVTPAPLPI